MVLRGQSRFPRMLGMSILLTRPCRARDNVGMPNSTKQQTLVRGPQHGLSSSREKVLPLVFRGLFGIQRYNKAAGFFR